MPIRVKDAAEILQISPGTVRNWCADGKLNYSLSAAGQKVFDYDYLIQFKNERLGIEQEPEVKIFYARSSNKNDVSIDTQLKKMERKYGKSDFSFTDNASGLNENRKGLNKLISLIKENDKPKILYITNKDRLAIFGFTYLEKLFEKCNCKIVVLDSDDTKEPHDVLMKDFMSVSASFSGKFYGLRGWKQIKRFLNDVLQEVKKHEK